MAITKSYSEFFDRPLTDPPESDTQFARYLVYRGIEPLHRSMNKATELLNEQGDDVAERTIRNTGHKFHWHERALAFDEHMAKIELEVLETTIDGAVEWVLGQEDIEIVMATRLLQRVMSNEALEKVEPSKDAKPAEERLLKILKAMETLQKMRRRRAGLPSNYTTEQREAEDFENQVYTIGGS